MDIQKQIEEALEKATKGAVWTNFDDVRCEYTKLVGVYDHLLEKMIQPIIECPTIEIAHLIANAPEWLRHQQSIISQQTTVIEQLRSALDMIGIHNGTIDAFNEIEKILEGNKSNVNT